MPASPTKRKVDATFTLRRVFGKSAFRPLQLQVINAALAGHDIFLCAATSFGKSLCYQLPAVVATGVTVVISPLLALMTNQVNAAKALGIATETISSGTPRSERTRIETDLLCGHPETRLLYVTPELCSFDHFRKLLIQIHRQGQLTRVAIDEAHCISEWGHDFRPAYQALSWFKQTLNCPNVPIMAVTATATDQVRDDVYKYLGLNSGTTLLFLTSIARPNIHYEVQYFSESAPKNGEDDVFPYLLAWLSRIHEKRVLTRIPTPIHGIIYCLTRSTADSLSSRLSGHGISSCAYHAGLDNTMRTKIQTHFLSTNAISASDMTNISQSFNIICATTAFGMGIDMPCVRFIVHYGLPRGMESFVQESGRAGRDNKAAASLVLYTREEKDRSVWRAGQDMAKEAAKAKANTNTHKKNGSKGQPQQVQAAQSKLRSLQQVVAFCENTNRCRHALIATYFGDAASKPTTLAPDTAAPAAAAAAVCEYACDVCKEGTTALRKRKDRGLATERDAMEFTQRERSGGQAATDAGGDADEAPWMGTYAADDDYDDD